MPFDKHCPRCGAPVAEIGGLGCCGAITANCEGSLDGVPAPQLEFDDDDPRWDDLEVHYWYEYTSEPAPDETSDGVACRCGR